jgi:hypothetical protein
MSETVRRPSGTQAYDRAASTFAKNIAVTRTVTPERIEHLSGLVRRAADSLAAKVIESASTSRKK